MLLFNKKEAEVILVKQERKRLFDFLSDYKFYFAVAAFPPLVFGDIFLRYATDKLSSLGLQVPQELSVEEKSAFLDNLITSHQIRSAIIYLVILLLVYILSFLVMSHHEHKQSIFSVWKQYKNNNS